MDVSSTSDWSRVRTDVESKFGSVDLLMLNAGASFNPEGSKTWEDPEYFHKTFAVNVFGPVNGLAAFLPLVQQTKEPASIIITGSKQGITNPPGNPAYNASKSAVKTITEHLAHDLRTSNPNISVHILIPGWTFTGLSGNSGPVPDEEAMKTKKPGA
jgi:NAD(P)-dependent dehydrogenase (short-subunit alcohol dehydrogenase family)